MRIWDAGAAHEEGSYLRLIDFVYHSTLGFRVTKKKKKKKHEVLLLRGPLLPLLSEKGTTYKVSRTFAGKSRPKSGLCVPSSLDSGISRFQKDENTTRRRARSEPEARNAGTDLGRGES